MSETDFILMTAIGCALIALVCGTLAILALAKDPLTGGPTEDPEEVDHA